MAALAILFWLIVLAADIAFMTQIKRLANEWFPLDGSPSKRKRPGRAGTRTKSMSKMTDLVYQIQKENATCCKQS